MESAALGEPPHDLLEEELDARVAAEEEIGQHLLPGLFLQLEDGRLSGDEFLFQQKIVHAAQLRVLLALPPRQRVVPLHQLQQLRPFTPPP